MYQTKTMEKLEMIECPKCGEPNAFKTKRIRLSCLLLIALQCQQKEECQ